MIPRGFPRHPATLLHASEVDHPTDHDGEMATCAICLTPIHDRAVPTRWVHVNRDIDGDAHGDRWSDVAERNEDAIATVLAETAGQAAYADLFTPADTEEPA